MSSHSTKILASGQQKGPPLDQIPVPATVTSIRGLRRSETAISSRRVFKLKLIGPTLLSPTAFDTLHIHHIDSERSEVFWCAVSDQTDVMRHPFYYQGIRANAVEGVSVSFEHLSAWQRPLQARPVFIFSIGRCGSTLFSNVCGAAGLQSWSEPDSFTNLATDQNLRENPWIFRALSRVALNDLADKAAIAGQASFGLKLRSHVTPICEELCTHHPDSLCFFLVRDPIDWAKSVHRTFGQGPVRLATRLVDTIEQLRLARARGLDVQVIDYEMLTRFPHQQVERIVSVIGGGESNQEALEVIMNTDAQKGTSIAQGTGRALPDAFVDRFRRAIHKRASWLLERAPETWLE